jgi:phage terminase large subunit GpA-like protein
VAVGKRWISVLRPPPPLKVSEWAKEYRRLSRKDSARPGRWRSEPHQDEIMDACRDPKVRRVVVMAASQVVGKSQMMDNIIGRFIDVDPSNMLVMHPTIAAAEKWSIGRRDPLITKTKRLHEKIQPRKSRSIGDRILHRQFRGGQMFIVGSNAPADRICCVERRAGSG